MIAQGKKYFRKILRFFFLFLKEYVCCDPSLELSWRDRSNDGVTMYVFIEKYGKLSLSGALKEQIISYRIYTPPPFMEKY